MGLTDLLADLMDQRVQIWTDGGRLRFRTREKLPRELGEELERRKGKLLAWIGEGRKLAPTSFAQQRLWFLDRLEPSTRFSVHAAWRLRGEPNLAALEMAIREIVRRHEPLRTSIESVAGRPFQVIRLAQADFGAARADLSGLPSAAVEAEARRLSTRAARRGFDLSRGPLFRALVLRLREGGLLVATLHHAIADGWSMAVFERELAAFYEAFATGRSRTLTALTLPALPGQYADFAVWQRHRLRGEVLESHLEFWKRELGGDPPALELPADRPRVGSASRRAGVSTLVLAQPLRDELARLGATAGASLFMVLLAAFAALLGRFSGRGHVFVGTPVAGRTRAELEPLIGLFVNTLVLRVGLAPRCGFRALLERVRETALRAFAHQDLPFEKLVEALRPERELDRTPLFQVLFNTFNFNTEPERRSGGLSLEPCFEFDNAEAHYDLALYAAEQVAAIRLDFVYRADLFDRSRVLRMLASLRVLLEAATSAPSRPTAELPLASPAESHQLLFEWSSAGRAAGAPAFPALAGAPDAVAVSFAGAGLPEVLVTYGELDRRSDRLADRLRRRGVGPEKLVGIRMGRSPRLVEAILAVWKAGGAYVPFDPAYPEGRLAWMEADSGPCLVLTDRGVAPGRGVPGLKPGAGRGRPFGTQDRGAESLGRQDAGVSSLAYAIYTSGSEGRPKGVLVSRGSLAAYLRFVTRFHGLTTSDTVLQVASASFDVSVRELIAPLSVGARLAMVDAAAARDPAALVRALERRRVTCLLGLVPSLFRAMLEVDARPFAGLRLLAFAGEGLPLAEVGRLREVPGFRARVVNQYGPTEGTGTSCAFVVEASEGVRGIAPIGRPHEHVAAYVLDRRLRALPAGVVGELCLAGAGLARGYSRRPAETAGRFVPSGLAGPGARLYRTGDLVRFRGDGQLEILGRADQQIKVRGVRVEPGEVEAVLARHPAVREAAVAARDGRLTAWLVPRGGTAVPSGRELRAFLAHELPETMVPSLFRTVDALPRTASGKVDRRRLVGQAPPAFRGESAGGACPTKAASPRTLVEEVLVEIWERVLGVARVGIDDDFFDLGGHSLLATQVLSRVREALGVDLSLRALFENPTVALLARRVEEGLSASSDVLPPLAPAPRDRDLPLSFAQLRLWFLHRLDPESAAYNMPAAWRLTGELHADALEAALRAIRRRHEVLRTTFPDAAGRPRQAVSPDAAFALPQVDLTAIPGGRRAAEERRVLAREENRPFDPARGPLARAALVRTGGREHVFLFIADHMVSDGWSYGLVCRELGELYAAACGSRPSPLPPLPIQYGDFAVWQRSWLDGDVLREQLDYWRRQLDGVPDLALPADRRRPAARRAPGAALAFTVPAAVAAGLRETGRAAGGSLFMTLLAACSTLLFRLAGQPDVAVGSPVAGRRRRELEELIGFFVNMIVIRARLEGRPRFSELVARIRESALDAYAHQDLPFERLVEELRPGRDPSRHPVFQVIFTLQCSPPAPEGALQNVPQAALELPGLDAVSLEPVPREARFDLELTFREDAGGLRGAFVYAADFDATTAARWVGHLRSLLAAVARRADLRPEEIPILAAAERHQVIVEANDTRTAPAAPSGVLRRVDDRATGSPESVAVVADAAHLTCGELDGRARSLAARLRDRGVGLETRVAVSLERSPDLVASLLAVLRSGGAFVPVDPAWPAARRKLVSAGCGAAVESAAPGARVDVAVLDSEPARRTPPRREAPESLAYVIYTSGSTGEPKGVMVAHGSLENLVASTISGYGIGPGDRVLQLASPSFDASVQDVFSALASGACLVLPGPRLPPSIRELSELMNRHRVTVVNPPTSFWHEWVDALEAGAAGLPATLRRVILGGEKVDGERVRAWRRHVGAAPVRLTDEYGPTECTVAATRADLTAWTGGDPPGGDPPGVPSIGRPIEGVEARVLGAAMAPVPIGIAGELHVGGAGPARGYLGRPRPTAERFVPDAFAARCGARLYKTGDLARHLPGGGLAYLGRIDSQVKIRGFRVEPGEIEAVLARHPRVRQAVVVARNEGRAPLAAYVVPARAAPASPSSEDLVPELRAWLAERLPEFMVPSRLAVLAALPALPSGKVDRRALAALEHRTPATESAFVAPRTPDEEALAEIWSEVLGIEQVGVDDDFFVLGGHSLLAVRLVARVEQRFGVGLPLAALLRHSTLVAMAGRLRSAGQPAGASPVCLAAAGAGPGLPFFCVRPAGGHLLCYAELARRMARERPFYILQCSPPAPQGALQSNGAVGTAADLAATYLDAILEVQPRGPLLVGGWSMGGAVAFEIARLARGRNLEVPLLALLDASDPRGADGAPATYEGRITLFRPAERDPDEADPTRGWSALAAEGVDVVVTPGDHHSMIRHPHVEVLAAELNRAIERRLGCGSGT